MAGKQAVSAVAAWILMLLSARLLDSAARAEAAGDGPTLQGVLQKDTASSQLQIDYACPQRLGIGAGSFHATGELVARDAAGFYQPVGAFSEWGTFMLDWTDPALPEPELMNLRTTFTLTFSDGSGLRAEGEREGSGGSCYQPYSTEAGLLGVLRIQASGVYRITFYDAQDQAVATESGRSGLVFVADGWTVSPGWPEDDPTSPAWPGDPSIPLSPEDDPWIGFRYHGEFHVAPPSQTPTPRPS